MITFIIESVVLCAIFTVMILLRMNKPLINTIYSYPPAIVDRVMELGLIPDTDRKTSSTKKASIPRAFITILIRRISSILCIEC